MKSIDHFTVTRVVGDDDVKTFTLFCDKCGEEIAEADDPALVVIKCDAPSAEDLKIWRARMAALEATRSVARAIIIDHQTEVAQFDLTRLIDHHVCAPLVIK